MNDAPNPYAPPRAQDPAIGNVPGEGGYVYRSLSGFSWIISAGLALDVLLDLVSFIGRRWDLPLLPQDDEQRRWLWIGLRWLSLLIVAIGLCLFMPRANRNARAFGCTPLTFTPRMAAAVFFIPIWSFYKPYRAMKELWQATTVDGPWQMAGTSPLLPWWWGTWIASRLLSRAASLVDFVCLLSFVAAGLFALVVRGLVDRFEERALRR